MTKVKMVGAVLGACLVAAPAASAASTGACSKVSASAVSAIVGYTVPAGVGMTTKLAATKQSDGISGVVTTCTYGAETSESALHKVVILTSETTSKSFTLSELKSLLAKNAAAAKAIKLVPYSGLGEPGFYFTEHIGGISAQGLAGFDGTQSEGADVFSSSISKSQLVALAKLAHQL
jgi:hypothetical protein